MKSIIVTFLILFSLCPVMGQPLKDSTALDFINSLLARRDRLDKFVLPSELKLSRRLDISYKDADKKYLISNDFDAATRREILENKYTFTFTIEKLSEHYSLLKAIIPALDIIKEYFFEDSLLISKPYYYARNWDIIQSRFFTFHLSSKAKFNEYAANKLDDFVARMARLLKFNSDQIKNLETEKINYFLCKDENEIEQLTGYQARGLYYLPYDYIISTYCCHFHELLHLLMNYKLKDLYLYTLPLFQEGFAVAYGGRGDKEPEVILDMGLFLVKSGMQDYNTLLSKQGFYQSDISLSYPVSGLYNGFLINQIGVDRYLDLYRKFSSSENEIDYLTVDNADLPSDTEWKEYIKTYSDSSINISRINSAGFSLNAEKPGAYKIMENADYYLFAIRDTIMIFQTDPLTGYTSKLFADIFHARKYEGQKYAVIADSNEISVYNFYSNNLMAKYISGFTADQKKISRVNGLYTFLVSKNLFDEPLKEMTIKD